MDRSNFRIIDGTLYRRDANPYAFDFRLHKLGDHLEATALPVHAWSEVDALSPQALQDLSRATGSIFVDGEWETHKPTEHELLARAAENRLKSTRRARSQVRRLVKHKRLDHMLTLTYQENMLDRNRIRRDVDVLIKRLRRILPSFEYICVFERQKRGAWHAHIACHRLQAMLVHKGVLVKSYTLVRSLWRSVIGGGGDADQSRGKAGKRSSGRLAGYLSKYIGKALDAGEGGNSYSSSGRALPAPEKIRWMIETGTPASEALWRLCAGSFDGNFEMHGAHLDGGAYFLSLSPSG